MFKILDRFKHIFIWIQCFSRLKSSCFLLQKVIAFMHFSSGNASKLNKNAKDLLIILQRSFFYSQNNIHNSSLPIMYITDILRCFKVGCDCRFFQFPLTA